MVAFLAAIPAILSAISGVTELVDQGKQVYEQITGKTPPEDQDGLASAVQDMTPEQQEQWAAVMRGRIEQYEAETERLKVQGGTVDADTLAQFSQPVRDYIGKMRMVTRPLVVRRMSHVMLLPLYTTGFDMVATVVNSVAAQLQDTDPFTLPKLTPILYGENTLYEQLLSNLSTPAAAIVISYMTLREVGKAGGPQAVAGKAMTSVKKIIGAFTGGK